MFVNAVHNGPKGDRTVQIQPYLFFEGRCEEALNFYRDQLGASILAMMRFSEAPPMDDQQPPAEGCAGGPPPDLTKIMHAEFRIGATTLMASDGMASGQPAFAGISLSMLVADVKEADRLFGLLSDGGQVQMPLGPTFFSPGFGMVADRFGVSWMVVVQAPGQSPP
jgi:PhnB protein